MRLVLRANGNPAQARGWNRVARAAVGDPRIQIIPGTLERTDAMALLKGSGCLVSPHRAEGFGRNIGEAIVLGVPVIATAFSGSGDYLRGPERLKSRAKNGEAE